MKNFSVLRVSLVLALSITGALALAGGINAATVHLTVGGSVVAPAANGDPQIGISLSGVGGNLTYTPLPSPVGWGSTGTITETWPSPPPGTTLTVLHGDVSQGCVRVKGNMTLVVGLIRVCPINGVTAVS